MGDTIVANVISGVAVAITVAIPGVAAAERYTGRREAEQAGRSVMQQPKACTSPQKPHRRHHERHMSRRL